jgi:hypothetical protein
VGARGGDRFIFNDASQEGSEVIQMDANKLQYTKKKKPLICWKRSQRYNVDGFDF